MLSHNILAFLDISGVHNNIVFLMTSLVIICLALCVILDIIGGVALALLMVVATMAITRSSLGNTSKQESSTEFKHLLGEYLPTFSSEQELKESAKKTACSVFIRPAIIEIHETRET